MSVSFSATAESRDFGPSNISDQARQLGNDRASQERAQREHAANMERERVRSEQERTIDGYQY